MKSVIFIIVTFFFASFSTLAQKAKGNLPKNDSTNIVLMQYSCPMHPDVTSDKPGKCPKCNMELNLSTKEKMKREVTHTYSCPIHTAVVSDRAGVCPECKEELVITRKGSKQVSKAYSCSMHPEINSKTPGKCPKCNMQLKASSTKITSEKH